MGHHVGAGAVLKDAKDLAVDFPFRVGGGAPAFGCFDDVEFGGGGGCVTTGHPGYVAARHAVGFGFGFGGGWFFGWFGFTLRLNLRRRGSVGAVADGDGEGFMVKVCFYTVDVCEFVVCVVCVLCSTVPDVVRVAVLLSVVGFLCACYSSL